MAGGRCFLWAWLGIVLALVLFHFLQRTRPNRLKIYKVSGNLCPKRVRLGVRARRFRVHGLPPPAPQGANRQNYDRILGQKSFSDIWGGEAGRMTSESNPELLYTWDEEDEKLMKKVSMPLMASQLHDFGIPVYPNMTEEDLVKKFRVSLRLLKILQANVFDKKQTNDPDLLQGPISMPNLGRLSARVEDFANLRRLPLNLTNSPSPIIYPEYMLGTWKTRVSAAKLDLPFPHILSHSDISRDLRVPGFAACSVIFAPDMAKPFTYPARFERGSGGSVVEKVDINIRNAINANLGYPGIAIVSQVDEEPSCVQMVMLKQPAERHAYIRTQILATETDKDDEYFWAGCTYRQFWFGPMQKDESPRELVTVYQRILAIRRCENEYSDVFFGDDSEFSNDEVEGVLYTVGYLPADGPLLEMAKGRLTTRDPVVVYAQKVRMSRESDAIEPEVMPKETNM
ncbi:hypothetical protein AAMO2058_000009000 [Amorphochlora amoebiformis]